MHNRSISPDIYRALAIAGGLEFYMRTGRKVNRAYTPGNMMRAASQITGKKFPPRDYASAAHALRNWAQLETLKWSENTEVSV